MEMMIIVHYGFKALIQENPAVTTNRRKGKEFGGRNMGQSAGKHVLQRKRCIHLGRDFWTFTCFDVFLFSGLLREYPLLFCLRSAYTFLDVIIKTYLQNTPEQRYLQQIVYNISMVHSCERR